jgi:hypothetical protein
MFALLLLVGLEKDDVPGPTTADLKCGWNEMRDGREEASVFPQVE